jgi:hypothetical protein
MNYSETINGFLRFFGSLRFADLCFSAAAEILPQLVDFMWSANSVKIAPHGVII